MRPDINNSPFTPQEDEVLVCLYNQLGSKWKDIAERMPGRTQAQVKNRFYLYLRPNKNSNVASLSTLNTLSTLKTARNSSTEMNIGSSSESYFFEDKDLGFDFTNFNQVSEPQRDAVPQCDIFQDFDFSNFLENNFKQRS